MSALFTLALGKVFTVAFIRALPFPAAWFHRKPLSCHACMVGWLLLVEFALVLRGSLEHWALTLASGGLAVLLLALLQRLSLLPSTEMKPPE